MANNNNYTYNTEPTWESNNFDSRFEANGEMRNGDKRVRRMYSTAVIDKLIKDRQDGYEIPYDAFFNRELDLRGPNISFEMTPEEFDEYCLCQEDPIYFIENYCKFMTDDGQQLVNLRDYQEKIITAVTDETYDPVTNKVYPKNKDIIIMASRQTGKTTTVCSFLAWIVTFHIDRNVMVIANKFETAKEIVDKLNNIFRGLPFFLKPGCRSFGKTGFILDNGCRLMSTATTKSTSIGFTIHVLMLDEFAHIPGNIVGDLWRSVYPTLSSSKISQCIITSTPNGTTNKFYELWTDAINHKKHAFYPIRVDYWEVPEHNEEWVEEQKVKFGEAEFAQEFALQFNINSKMLVKASDMMFWNHMKTQFRPIEGLGRYGSVLNDPDLVWHPDFDPRNIKPGEKFVILVDTAEGNEDPDLVATKKEVDQLDSNTLNIFKVIPTSPANLRRFAHISCKDKDCFKFVQVGRYMSNTKDEEYAAKLASAISYELFKDDLYDSVRVMVEMNFNGKSFTTTFKQHPRYSESTLMKTFHTKPVPGEKQRRRLGFKTLAGSKDTYCIKGAKLANMRRIIVSDEITINQINSFGYVKNKLGGIACHDDLSFPVFNEIPRLLDDELFVYWAMELIDNMPDSNPVKYKINQIIKKWDMEADMPDEQFNAIAGLENGGMPSYPAGWGGPQNTGNPYMSSNLPNPYAGGNSGNPYTSGANNLSGYSNIIKR